MTDPDRLTTPERRPEDLETYDRVFAAWWERVGALPMAQRQEQEIALAFDVEGDDEPDGDDGDGPPAPPSVQVRWSRHEVLRHRDFAEYTADEFLEARRLMADLRVAGAIGSRMDGVAAACAAAGPGIGAMTAEIIPAGDAMERAVPLLEAGEVVAIPTETVSGLAGDASLPERLERFHDPRELEARPGALRRPVHHRDAVRHVSESEPNRARLEARRGKRRRHRIENGKCDDRSHSLEEASARQVHSRNDHGVLAIVAALRDWKGRLLTISRISPENRYSCSVSRLTIPLTVRLS